MTTTPHPYPAYRPSGVPWLGDVPAHWEVSAIKNGYEIQLGKMLQTAPQTPNDKEVPYLKAVHVQWFSVQMIDPPMMWANPREIAQFGIQEGDLLVCEGGEGGRSGIVWSAIDGYIIQNALHRIRPKGSTSNQYLQFVMYVAAAYGWFDALNAKATIAHFTREKLAAFQIPLPPLPEQRAIVRYLDHVDRRIRQYVSAKRKLIALLEEEKQAVVNRAVTRGLDSNIRLKPSGVEWLGDVPEHWEVRRLEPGIGNPQTASPLNEYSATMTSHHCTTGLIRSYKTGEVAGASKMIMSIRADLERAWFGCQYHVSKRDACNDNRCQLSVT